MRIWRKWHHWSLAPKRVLLGVTAGMSVALIFFVIMIHGFLAVSNPVGEGVLVVEAWIPSRTLAESVILFNSGRYRYFVVVGGPMQGSGGNSSDPTTYADLAVTKLEELGLDSKRVVKISASAESSVFGRTLASATAVKRWLASSGTSVCCVDVFTAGVHARKSWILFRYALGGGYRVGIIAGSPGSYDPSFWLASRRGVWLVIRNLAGCVYSKVWILLHGKCLQAECLLFGRSRSTRSPDLAA